MIVGFSKHGTGGSTGPIQYLTGTQSPDGTVRQPAPVVLRGDPDLVGRLIDSLDFTHKYTSGVLSFAPGEVITDTMAEQIMDQFERIAFSGLEKDQYSILWVRHTHAGHHELNFLVPRVELSTGKSLNIAPPGKASRALFDTFRSWVNATFGLADPEDPTRAQDVSLPNHLARVRAEATRKGEALKDNLRAVITEHVRRAVDAGTVKDRDGVEAFLKAQGYTLPRAGKDYLTVLDPQTGEKLRLKGGLYTREHFNPYDTTPRHVRYGVPDPERAAELATTLERLSAARARYHQERYGRPDAGRTRQRTPRGPALPGHGDALPDYLHQTLGDEAITPRQDDATPARSTQRRRRRQRMQEAAAALGKGTDDRPRTALAHRPGTAGGAVRGPRTGDGGGIDGLARARGALDQAGQRLARTGGDLIRATRAFGSHTPARLDEWWWRYWYGEGRAR